MAKIIQHLTLFVILVFMTFSAFGQRITKAPIVAPITSCSAKQFTLEVQNPSEEATYSWYDVQGNLIPDVTGPLFITQEIIGSTTYSVSATIDEKESERTAISITLEHSASILENWSKGIGLCGGEITLTGSHTFAKEEDVTYQWQLFKSNSDLGETQSGTFINILDEQGGKESILRRSKEGFYRLQVQDTANNCLAISAAIEVINDVPFESRINNENDSLFFCFDFIERSFDPIMLSSVDVVPEATYRWEISEDNTTNFSLIANNDMPSLVIDSTFFSTIVSRKEIFVRLQINRQNCTSDYSDTIKIIIASIPQVVIYYQADSLSSDFFYCESDPTQNRSLIASYDTALYPNSIISWSRSISNSDTLVLGAEEESNYTAIIMDTITMCSKASNSIFAETAISGFTGNFSFCFGESTTLTASENQEGNFVWSFSTTETGPFTRIDNQNNKDITVGPDNVGFYQLSVTVNGCTVESAPVEVSEVDDINPEVETVLGLAQMLCTLEDSIIFRVLNPEDEINYSWRNVDIVGNPSTEGTLFIAYEEGNYELMANNGICETRLPLTVTLFDTSAYNLKIIDDNTCSPTSIYLNKTTTLLKEWHFSGDGINFNLLEGEVKDTLSVSQSGNYFAVVHSENCRKNSDTIFIEQGITTPIVQRSLAESERLCSNTDSVTFTISNPDTSVNYFWFKGENNNLPSNTSEITETSSFTAYEMGTYQLFITSRLNEVCTTQLSYIVNEIGLGEKNIGVDNETSFCGTTKMWINNSPSDLNVQWFFSFDKKIFEDISSFHKDSIVSQEAGFYTAQLSNGDCIMNTDTIQIFPELEENIINTNLISICGEAGLATLSSVEISNIKYQWGFSENNTTYSDILGATKYLHTTSNSGFYKLTISTENCFAESNAVQVNISDEYPSFDADIDGPIFVCTAGTGEKFFTLKSVYESPSVVYQWFYSDNSFEYTKIPNSNTSSLLVKDDLYLLATDGEFKQRFFQLLVKEENCQSLSNPHVVIFQSTGSSSLAVEGGLIHTSKRGELYQLEGVGADTYEWLPKDLFINNKITNPILNIPINNISDTIKALVIGRNDNGCESSLEVKVILKDDPSPIQEELRGSKIITPNGDGINDFFEVPNIEHFPNNEVFIFQTTGRVIYSTKGYQNNSSASYELNEVLIEEVYYYTIDFGDGTTVSGHFLIIR